MWELEIAKIFCLEIELEKFHRLFLSCNEPINDAKQKGENHRIIVAVNQLVCSGGKKKIKRGKENREENSRKRGSGVESSVHILKAALQVNSKQTKCEWCCVCEKCAFIFLLLSAWLPLQGALRGIVLYCIVFAVCDCFFNRYR